ncbi:F-box only protein 21-like, partial [Formica exsecta]|uniref:F-box only protein 21-like n=1 Tax=Formica exsecta TaxID=72781 RepID=UPI0011413C25
VRSNAVKEPLKRRTKNVKFAVGMIVTHTWKGYFSNNHDGVIIGWNHKCDRMFRDKLDKTIMLPYLHKCCDFYHICECQQFSASVHQLHYIILAENHRVCYVQQDQLSICSSKKIDNIEIGRYFSSFEGTYYVPNESLRKHYPNDTAAIAKILAKQ